MHQYPGAWYASNHNAGTQCRPTSKEAYNSGVALAILLHSKSFWGSTTNRGNFGGSAFYCFVVWFEDTGVCVCVCVCLWHCHCSVFGRGSNMLVWAKLSLCSMGLSCCVFRSIQRKESINNIASNICIMGYKDRFLVMNLSLHDQTTRNCWYKMPNVSHCAKSIFSSTWLGSEVRACIMLEKHVCLWMHVVSNLTILAFISETCTCL